MLSRRNQQLLEAAPHLAADHFALPFGHPQRSLLPRLACIHVEVIAPKVSQDLFTLPITLDRTRNVGAQKLKLQLINLLSIFIARQFTLHPNLLAFQLSQHRQIHPLFRIQNPQLPDLLRLFLRPSHGLARRRHHPHQLIHAPRQPSIFNPTRLQLPIHPNFNSNPLNFSQVRRRRRICKPRQQMNRPLARTQPNIRPQHLNPIPPRPLHRFLQKTNGSIKAHTRARNQNNQQGGGAPHDSRTPTLPESASFPPLPAIQQRSPQRRCP